MRKIKYLMFSILALIGTLIGLSNVNAENYNGSIKTKGYISGPYYYMHVEGTHRLWDQVNEIIRTSDGERVYCIQPFAQISSKGTYQVTSEDVNQILNLELDDWRLISKIAYYGWDYKDATHDHRDDKWYVATQMLLWKVVTPNVDSYFTSTLKGERNDSILKNEMDEIMDLVNSHLIKPDFSNMPDKMIVNQTITITDSKNVLEKYDLANVEGGEVTKNGNSITIKATKVGNISFSLQKLGNRYSEPTKLYYAVDYQNALHKGNIDPINVNFNVPVFGGDVTIEKTDYDTYEQKPQGSGSLAGAVYGVFKEDGTRVGSLTTDENGYAKSDYLPTFGRFYVLEEKASLGYELDKNKYYFDVTQDNLHPNIQVFEKVIERTYDITKVFADSETSIMTPEPNVKFGFYNSKNELVKELTTDSQGNLKITLPYGVYKVKQLTTPDGYEKIKEFTIRVESSGSDIKMVISNAEITAKLKVIKIDAESGNIIKRSNIKFRILDVNTGKYVKQTITYPTAKTIEVYETDENGILITPYPLESGRYELEEVEDQKIEGYVWNSKSLAFEIGANSKFIDDEQYGLLLEVKFANEQVKGELNVSKVGEKLVINETGFHYEEIELDGVCFELYANEDIYSQDGALVYHDNELIKSFFTKDGSYKIADLYLGKYYLIERTSIGNHVLDDTKHYFELNYEDQYTRIVTHTLKLKNYLKKGELEFTKTDLAGNPLPNTTITIFTNNEGEEQKLVFKGKTDEFGHIIIKDLFPSKFVIFESEAPEGYILNPEPIEFEIKEDGEIVKATMTNEKIVIDVPITESNKDQNIYTTGVIFIVLGIGATVYVKIKKRK